MDQEPASDEMARQLRAAWFRYLDTIEPIRPALYRYCRRITRDLWETEDLLQETLLKGFGAIGRGDLFGEWSRVKDSRAYLFRVATNLWIDQLRRGEVRTEAEVPEPPVGPEQSVATREAASMLLARAAPQERAAVVLKDVFDFTLEEIAVMLSTTVGAVKSALHRGRASLEETKPMKRDPYRAPSKNLVDRFVEAFNARDVERVTNLLLENVTLEVPGVGGERGKQMIWVRASMGAESAALRVEAAMYRGEWIVLVWAGEGPGRVLVSLSRFEEEDGYIARIRNYTYCPETVAELGAELGVPVWPRSYHQTPERLVQDDRLIRAAVGLNLGRAATGPSAIVSLAVE